MSRKRPPTKDNPFGDDWFCEDQSSIFECIPEPDSCRQRTSSTLSSPAKTTSGTGHKDPSTKPEPEKQNG